MKRIATFIFLSFALSFAFGQAPQKLSQDYIGTSAPELHFNIYENSGKTAIKKSLEDYRGKWLVIDFWTRYCTVCITGMPKLQKLKEKFATQANFLLVGMNDKKTGSGIETLYRRIALEERLNLDIAFDTVSFKSFAITTTPKAIIISPDGTISAYTYGTELTAEKLEQLFDTGKNPFPIVDEVITIKKKRKLLFEHISTEDLDHSSKLFQWQKGEPTRQLIDLDRDAGKDSLLARQISLEKLYLLAYLGKSNWSLQDSLYFRVWPKVMIETRDSAVFKHQLNEGTGMFSYEAKRPVERSNKGGAMKMMQQDLQEWFEFRAKWQTRMMPSYKLVYTGRDSTKLKTMVGEKYALTSLTKLEFRNVPVKRLIEAIMQKQHNLIEDRTRIEFPIDITIEGNMLSIGSVQKALEVYGLELVPSKKPMRVLVISDK